MINMSEKFTSIGKIVYDPTAGNAKNPWWVIVECPKDILDYYHHWIKKEENIKLNKPLFGAHISVVRGEEPPLEKQNLWRKYHEKEITFSYQHEVENLNEYYWLSVECPELNELREELGLSPEVEFGFHLTIGRVV
jgi:hypothetical protein